MHHLLRLVICFALAYGSSAENSFSAMGFVSPGVGMLKGVANMQKCRIADIALRMSGDNQERLEQLSLQLELAVKDERYSDAARLKKEIDQVKIDSPSSLGGSEQATSPEKEERRTTTLEELRQREIRRLRGDIDPGGDNMATPW